MRQPLGPCCCPTRGNCRVDGNLVARLIRRSSAKETESGHPDHGTGWAQEPEPGQPADVTGWAQEPEPGHPNHETGQTRSPQEPESGPA